MYADHINPAILGKQTDAEVYALIRDEKAHLERAFAVCDEKHTPGENTVIRAGRAFELGFEMYEYLCERTGLNTIPDDSCHPEDWYKAPPPSGWWDTALLYERNSFASEFKANYGA